MTKDKALRLALSTLNEVRSETFRLMRNGQTLYAAENVWDTINAIKEALAQPEQELTGIREIRVTETVKPEQEPVIDCPFCLHSFRLRDVYTTPPKEKNT